MRMHTLVTLILLAGMLVTSGCGQETQDYNTTLDADRTAREKIVSALSIMAEVLELREEGSEEALASAEDKEQAARKAYDEAVERWDLAKAGYVLLVEMNPKRGDYHNNLGNMIYFKIMSGLEGDYQGAEKHLETAISLDDRPIYRRNLELLYTLNKRESEGDLSAMGGDNYEKESKRIYADMLRNRELINAVKQVVLKEDSEE